MAYTPGPWRVDAQYKSIVDSTNTLIRVSGVAVPCGYVPDTDISYDNARLVAAAPELLEVLKECASELKEEIDARYGEMHSHPAMAHRYERDIQSVNKALEAIAKAQGRE